MCGILGAFNIPPIASAAVDAALDSIRHRGPDDSGFYQDALVTLGMRRLAIIDKAGGHQPIANEDGTVLVVLNGEIYNYRELKNGLVKRGHRFSSDSDTETLVHLYEERGPELVTQLRGMFAFAIYDKRNGKLLISRDRFGKKPLYYRVHRNGIVFASEIKALLPLLSEADISPSIRPQAIYDYLSFGYIPQPDTIYKEVATLPPATTLSAGKDGVGEPVRYWRLPARPLRSAPYSEIIESVRQTIAPAVRLRLRSDVPIGLLLSGGLDSSIVAFEAARAGESAIETFTIAVKNESLDESKIAANTAARLGLRHTTLALQIAPADTIQFLARHYDQPFADPSAIPSYEVCRLARTKVTVLLNGDGGDEIFGGYRRHLAAHHASKLRWIPRPLWVLLESSVAFASADRRSRTGLLRRISYGMKLDTPERYLAWTSDLLLDRQKQQYWLGAPPRLTKELLTNIGQNSDFSVSMMEGDINYELPSALLVKMDMASMAASVEARSPLLDHHVAEMAASIDVSSLFRGGRTKAVLRDAYRGELSQDVIDGPKRGFEIPLEDWLRGELRPMIYDCVLSSRAHINTFIDPRFVRGVIQGSEAQGRNWAALTYALLMLELWLKGRS